MSNGAQSDAGGHNLTRRQLGQAILTGSAAIVGLGARAALAGGPLPPLPRRFASGIAEGHLRPLVCGGPGRSCSAGLQLDALLSAIGVKRGQHGSHIELKGVFAADDGFVATFRAFDAKREERWRYDGYGIDGCRVELVDIAVGVADRRMSRAEFEEVYLFKMTTDTLDLTAKQRSKLANGARYAKVAVRVEVRCLVPDRRYQKNLKRVEIPVVIENYLPGFSGFAVIE